MHDTNSTRGPRGATRQFFAADPACWPAIASVLPKPWPIEAIYTDLAYWQDRERLKAGSRPGRVELARRWGVTDWRVKAAMKDEGRWGDGFKSAASAPPADRQRTASAPPAEERSNAENDSVSASAPPAHRQPTASRPPRARNTTQSHSPQSTEAQPKESASATTPPVVPVIRDAHPLALDDEQDRPHNVEPKPRSKLTGTKPMPNAITVDPHEVDRQRCAARDRYAAVAGEPAPIPLTDWRPWHALVKASGYDEAVAARAIDWLLTAADGAAWGGNEATWTHGKGIRWALTQRAERMVEASAAWDRAGRPKRGEPHAPKPSAWDDMSPRLRAGTSRGARILPHNPNGIMLADDEAEHDKRRAAWREVGGLRRWGETTSDYQRNDLRRAWCAAYGEGA